MLGKKYRTPVQKFPRKAKIVYNGRLFVIKNFPNALTHSRVGIIVSKNVVRGAVKRNKIKRVVMGAFQDNERILKTPGTDHLVIISSSDKLDGVECEELKKELEGALAKLERW